MMMSRHHISNLVICCDPTVGDQPARYQLDKYSTWKKKKERMADWDDIINNRITMGCAKLLCHALNAARRRREEGIEEWRPG